MKTLFLIGGPMGVGKTTVCQILKRKLPKCVFLDGDWCWDMHPFSVTPETKEMVLENIRFLLRQFLHCSAFENIVFCWVMHEQEIIDAILDGLELNGYHVRVISLLCEEEELRKRLQKDVNAGLREETVIGRSVARIGLYEKLGAEKIDVSGLTPERTAEKILTGEGEGKRGEERGRKVKWNRRENLKPINFMRRSSRYRTKAELMSGFPMISAGNSGKAA